MTRIVKYLFFFILLLGAGAQEMCAQQIAVKTNGLSLLAGVPNLGCELVVGERSSVDLSFYGGYKPWGTDIKLIGVQPEFRYWFNGRPMVREYIGISALGASYDMHLGKHIYDGDAIGIGITMGYSMVLGKRLNLEFSAGFGAVCFWHQQYYENDNFEDYLINNPGKTNAHGYKLFPAKLAVSISYIIR